MYRQIGRFDDNTIATMAVFDENNRMISFTTGDFENNETLTDIHEYDAKSRLVRIISSYGYWVEFNYNKNGTIMQTASNGMIREVDSQSDCFIHHRANSIISEGNNTNRQLLKDAMYDNKDRLIVRLNWNDQVIRYTYKDVD